MMFGANTDELRAFATGSHAICDDLHARADRLRAVTSQLAWTGLDAHHWRNTFNETINTLILLGELTESSIAQELRTQADQQDRASAGTPVASGLANTFTYRDTLGAVDTLKESLNKHVGFDVTLDDVLEWIKGVLESIRKILEEYIRRLTELAAIDWTALLISLFHDENFLKLLSGLEELSRGLGVFGAFVTGLFAGVKRFAYDLQNYPNMPLEMRIIRALVDGGLNFGGTFLGAYYGELAGAALGGAIAGTGGAAAGTAAGPGYGTAAGGGVGLITGAGLGGLIGSMVGGWLAGTAADMFADWLLDDFFAPNEYR